MARNNHKCEHINCHCMVAADEKYCSEYCRDAADVDVIEAPACGCAHKPCHDAI